MTIAPGELSYSAAESRARALAGHVGALLPGLLGAAAVGGVAASNGGYYPEVWNWMALGLLWFSILALILRSEIRIGVLGIAFSGGLALFAGWSALSIAWTSSATLSVLDTEKLLVYVGVVLAALLVVRRRAVPQLLGGVLLGITAVCAYALATRLFPERLGNFDPLGGYRLTVPVGYWNSLGLFAGIGIALAAGLAARAERPWRRALAAAPLPLLMATFFFTFSRGAWVALAAGLVAAILLDPRRLQLLAAFAVLAPWPALTVLLADRSKALTTITAPIASASHQGHRLALWILLLSLAAAAAGFALGAIERRVQVPRAARLGFAAVIVAALLAGLGGAWAHWGSPPTIARKAYDSFRAPPSSSQGDLSQRLLSLSSNGRWDLWRAAIQEFGAHPLAGRGAGTYRQAWYARRPYDGQALDAHNLYLQTLAELGIVGFVVLLAALLAPVAAAVRARHRPFVPAAFGAYAAFLVHNFADWDWQLTGVGAAGLLCGVALVAGARTRGVGLSLPLPARLGIGTVAVALAVFALVAELANAPLSNAQAAAQDGRWTASAADARKAETWAPWSSQPWQLLGEAQLAQGQIAAAQGSFRTAIAKDPKNWNLWVDLTLATTGAEHRRALATAEKLNPKDTTLPQLATPGLIQKAGSSSQ